MGPWRGTGAGVDIVSDPVAVAVARAATVVDFDPAPSARAHVATVRHAVMVVVARTAGGVNLLPGRRARAIVRPVWHAVTVRVGRATGCVYLAPGRRVRATVEAVGDPVAVAVMVQEHGVHELAKRLGVAELARLRAGPAAAGRDQAVECRLAASALANLNRRNAELLAEGGLERVRRLDRARSDVRPSLMTRIALPCPALARSAPASSSAAPAGCCRPSSGVGRWLP